MLRQIRRMRFTTLINLIYDNTQIKEKCTTGLNKLTIIIIDILNDHDLLLIFYKLNSKIEY